MILVAAFYATGADGGSPVGLQERAPAPGVGPAATPAPATASDPPQAPAAPLGEEPNAEPPPLPDLTGAEPPVVAKIGAARRYVLANPGSAHAWGELAMSLDVHGFPREALPCYRRAAQLAPGDFRWPYYEALALAGLGPPDAVAAFAAFAAFERARALAPDYAPLQVRYGDALAAAGETDRAAAAYRRAAEVDPGLSHAELGLARLAVARGDLDGALAAARRAVQASPRFGEAHGLLADLLRRQGDAEAAAAEVELARRLPATTPLADPVYNALAAEGVSSFWAQRRGRAYLERGEAQRAVDELEQALRAAPRAEVYDDLGLALQRLGRFAAAAEHHRAALALRPGFTAAAVHLGEALAGGGDLAGALAAEERALALDPASTAAALDLGTLELRAGRRREAAAAFRAGLASDPDDPRLAARLAWLLATAPEDSLRDGAEAVRLAEGASRATGDRLPEALDVLAAAYAEAGRFEDATATARRAGELATAAGLTALVAEVAQRLALYEEGKPYRQ